MSDNLEENFEDNIEYLEDFDEDEDEELRNQETAAAEVPDLFLSVIREFPIIWDLGHPGHKDKVKVLNAWKRVAEISGKEGRQIHGSTHVSSRGTSTYLINLNNCIIHVFCCFQCHLLKTNSGT